MHRFFVTDPAGPWPIGTELQLDRADAVHAARVLRLRAGQFVLVSDGDGFDYEAELLQVSPNAVQVRIVSVAPSPAEPRAFLTLVQGVAKGSKMDFIIQKAVEIGVSRIIPVVTERTVVRLDRAKAAARVERWQRIAEEAAKQAGRGRVPVVEEVVHWSDVWQWDDLGTVLVPWEEAAGRGLMDALQHRPQTSDGVGSEQRSLTVTDAGSEQRVVTAPTATDTGGRRAFAVVIGPEGGLSPAEVDLAKSYGALPVTLGPRILRTETAAIVSVALVLAACGEMG